MWDYVERIWASCGRHQTGFAILPRLVVQAHQEGRGILLQLTSLQDLVASNSQIEFD
jgi:hypothetical protein